MRASLLKVRGRFGGSMGRTKLTKCVQREGQNSMLNTVAKVVEKHRKLQNTWLFVVPCSGKV